MEPFEWVALVGAAAWLPHVGNWIYRTLVTPKIHFVPDRELELGYTNYGPIINVRASLFADRKDAIIEEIFLTATHERGRQIALVWQSYIEKFSEIRSATGETAEASRDQPATALRASTLLPIDRFIRFQDPDFQRRWRSLINDVVTEQARLEAAEGYQPEMLLQSREYHALMEHLRHSFPWEAGTYSLKFRIKVLGLRGEFSGSSQFTLTNGDIDRLRETVSRVIADIEAVVRNVPQDERKPLQLNWAAPHLSAKDLGLKRPVLKRKEAS